MEQMIVQFIVNADRDVVNEVVAEFFCHAGIPMPALKADMMSIAACWLGSLAISALSFLAHSWPPPF